MIEKTSDLLPVQIAKCEFTSTSLDFSADITFPEWIHIGNQLGSLGEASQWWLGDWCNYGSKKDEWGSKANQAKAAQALSGLNWGTCRVYAWVAGSFNQFVRQITNLKFAHFQEVASIESEKERAKWLEKASEGEWTVPQLRGEIRLAQGKVAVAIGQKPNKTVIGWLASGENLLRRLGEPSDMPSQQRAQLREDMQAVHEFCQKLYALD